MKSFPSLNVLRLTVQMDFHLVAVVAGDFLVLEKTDSCCLDIAVFAREMESPHNQIVAAALGFAETPALV